MALRVVQWETADTGMYATRALLSRSDLELVGVYVASEERAGREVSEVVAMEGYVDLPPTGITTTTDKDAILAMDADCVVHTPPQELDPEGCIDDICAILASGKNVSSTAIMRLIHPRATPDSWRERIEEACAAGNTTFHGGGINPGYFAEVLPSMLTSVTTDIRKIVCTEFHSYEPNPDKYIVVDHVGMGGTLEAKEAKIVNRAALYGRPAIELLAEAVGLQIDDVTFDFELYAAEEELEIAACTIPKGTFAGSLYRFGGVVDGEERIRLDFVHRARSGIATHWPAAPADPDAYTIEIDAVPRLFNTSIISVDVGIPTYSGVGIQAVNSVPAVVAAAPGFRTRLELGLFGAPALRRGEPSLWRGGWS